jgi:hypothetical protein
LENESAFFPSLGKFRCFPQHRRMASRVRFLPSALKVFQVGKFERWVGRLLRSRRQAANIQPAARSENAPYLADRNSLSRYVACRWPERPQTHPGLRPPLRWRGTRNCARIIPSTERCAMRGVGSSLHQSDYGAAKTLFSSFCSHYICVVRAVAERTNMSFIVLPNYFCSLDFNVLG